MSEWQQDIERLLAVACLLHVGDLPASPIGDARFRRSWSESMVLSLWMSSRAHDAGDDQLADLEIDAQLPASPLDHQVAVGQDACVTTAATLVCTASWRLIEPFPSLEELPSAVRMRPGRIAVAECLDGFRSEEIGDAGILAVGSAALGLVGGRLAVSVMLTTTVNMSPTWWARWSLKNSREPERQSEFSL